MVGPSRYVPDRGEVVWLEFTPQAGYEQSGHRPALVISPKAYNRKVGLALFCPITTRIKGYPFEVVIPFGLKVSGAILADQVKNLDWRIRKAERIMKLPGDLVEEVQDKIISLVGR